MKEEKTIDGDYTLLENDKQGDDIHEKITSLVDDFVKNMKKMLSSDKSNSPSQFAQTIWDKFVKLFGEVNESLKNKDLTLKVAATSHENLKEFKVLFNFMRKFGKIERITLKQFENIMGSIRNKDGNAIEKIANGIVTKLENIEKIEKNETPQGANSGKIPGVIFQSAENLIELKNDNDQGALKFLSANWENFAGKFNVGFDPYFNNKFESNPKWFGTLAKEVSEANGGQFKKNILEEIKIDDFENGENGSEVKTIIDYKNGHIKDVLDFLRNAKEKCGYEESEAFKEGEKQFAKKLFKWCDDVLEGYSKRRKMEIKQELENKKKEKLEKMKSDIQNSKNEKLKLKSQKEHKKIEKEKDVYISETQRHLHEATKCFSKEDKVGGYKHVKKAFDLLCLLAESEITNNKSDKKGLKGWYIDCAKKINKYDDKEISYAIYRILDKKYQNKGFLGFGKSRLTKIYKEINEIKDLPLEEADIDS